MGNVLHKRCRENQNTQFMLNNFFSENFIVCEIMSKNVVETEGPQMTSQYGSYALHAGKARLHPRTSMDTPTRSGTRTHAHLVHQVLIIAFPQQQWSANAPQYCVTRTLPPEPKPSTSAATCFRPIFLLQMQPNMTTISKTATFSSCLCDSSNAISTHPHVTPEKSYRLWCVTVWSRNVKNEVAPAHVGLLRHRGTETEKS